jgi:hypothetical protein
LTIKIIVVLTYIMSQRRRWSWGLDRGRGGGRGEKRLIRGSRGGRTDGHDRGEREGIHKLGLGGVVWSVGSEEDFLSGWELVVGHELAFTTLRLWFHPQTAQGVGDRLEILSKGVGDRLDIVRGGTGSSHDVIRDVGLSMVCLTLCLTFYI